MGLLLAVDLVKSFPLWAIIALLIVGGAVVWFAGTKLSGFANIIERRTGAGQAFIGALLLGSVTSLPEVATTVTASYIGSAPLAVNNIFGGVAMQVTILAALDFFIKNKALSFAVKDQSVSIQAALSALLLVIALMGITIFQSDAFKVNIWTPLILVFTIAFFYILKKLEKDKQNEDMDEQENEDNASNSGKLSNTRLTLYTILASVTILIAGFIVTISGDTIATKTNLSEGLVGAVLIAVTTSLPELSTSIAAMRMKKYKMMCSNIFGSNVFDISLICLADALYSKGPILQDIEGFSQFGALLAVLVTLCYVAGFQVRRNYSFLRAGIDSWFVLLFYLAGIVLLYLIK